jgi:hypothetical protein
MYLPLRFLDHTYPVFSFFLDSGDAAIHQHSDAMLLFVSTFLHFSYVVDPLQSLMFLLIPSLYIFIGFQPHEIIFLKISYASGEDIPFSCELSIRFLELTLNSFRLFNSGNTLLDGTYGIAISSW